MFICVLFVIVCPSDGQVNLSRATSHIPTGIIWSASNLEHNRAGIGNAWMDVSEISEVYTSILK